MLAAGSTRVRDPFALLAAFVSLLLPLLVPAGYMVAPAAGGAAIVVCTGHGPLVIHRDESGKSGAPARAHASHVCAFAGHGSAPLAPVALIGAAARFEPLVASMRSAADLLPGRGLAAPPPPSRGPPTFLI